MGQSPSRSNSQDAPKPETISGPMPLGSVNAGGVQTRTLSGEHNRMRRDRRQSRDSTPGSPIAGSYTNLPSSRERTTGRRDSMSTVATAPPPYTAEPHRREVQLAEAPPPEIPPRSSSPQGYGYQYPQEKKPLSFGQAGELQSHRRTVSHSVLAGPSASRTRALSPNSRRRMPSLAPSSVPTIPGGFRFDMPSPPTTLEESRTESWHTAAESEVVSSPDSLGPETPIATRFETGPVTRVTNGSQTTPTRRGSREDPLEMLRRYKTVMIVDDSSSMEGESWAEARDALAGLADAAAKYDQEGIDVHFLNDHRVGINMKNGVEVKRLFDHIHPNGITPTGEKLEQLLLAYMNRLETARDQDEEELVKPVNFIVITDGAPTDDPESVIVATARRLDAGHFPLMQVGIQFVQIGTAEDTAEALRELDDGLAHQHGIRDMVDTTPYTGSEFNTELLVKILLGGINRRVDRHGATSVI